MDFGRSFLQTLGSHKEQNAAGRQQEDIYVNAAAAVNACTSKETTLRTANHVVLERKQSLQIAWAPMILADLGCGEPCYEKCNPRTCCFPSFQLGFLIFAQMWSFGIVPENQLAGFCLGVV